MAKCGSMQPYGPKPGNVTSYRLRLRDSALEHDIATKGLLGLRSFRGKSRLSTWFYRIAQNEAQRALRAWIEKRKRFISLPEDDPDEESPHPPIAAIPANLDATLDLEKLQTGLQTSNVRFWR